MEYDKNGWKYLTKKEVQEMYDVTDEELDEMSEMWGVKRKVLNYKTCYEYAGTLYTLAHRKRKKVLRRVA